MPQSDIRISFSIDGHINHCLKFFRDRSAKTGDFTFGVAISEHGAASQVEHGASPFHLVSRHISAQRIGHAILIVENIANDNSLLDARWRYTRCQQRFDVIGTKAQRLCRQLRRRTQRHFDLWTNPRLSPDQQTLRTQHLHPKYRKPFPPSVSIQKLQPFCAEIKDEKSSISPFVHAGLGR